MDRFIRTALSMGSALFMASPSVAQCPEVSPGFHVPGVNGTVLSMFRHDDGTRERLYVGGLFTAVGDVPARNIAVWDGANWSPVGEGVSTAVRAMAFYDDGSGPELYAGGGGYLAAPGLHRYDGSTWTPIPVIYSASQTSHPIVHALAVHDAGGGEALYVGGFFDSIAGVPAEGLARYSGSWSNLGGALNGRTVQALASYDDGSGPRLYVGGDFYVSGIDARYIASWDGTDFAALGVGLSPSPTYSYEDVVLALEVFDDGHPDGPALFVGGRFGEPGTGLRTSWARWSSTGWQLMPACCYTVFDFTVQHRGTDAAALVFASTGGLQRWDDPVLTSLGANPRNGVVEAFHDGTRSRLVAGGQELAPESLSEWRSGTWTPVADGGEGLAPWGLWGGRVWSVGVFESGATRELLVGSGTPFASTTDIPSVSRYDGEEWHALGDNLAADRVLALTTHDDGSGRALYAAGEDLEVNGLEVGVARFNGTNWERVGSQSAGIDVNALGLFRDSGATHLFAGGRSNQVRRWNGTGWSTVGGVLDYPAWGANVTSMATFDDGSGEALYIAGRIANAGGTIVANIARWTGTNWEGVGGGLTDGDQNNLIDVLDLAVFDSPDGEVLVAAGRFELAGGTPIKSLAAWNGVVWTGLGTHFDGESDWAESIESFDPDGNGERLYVRGRWDSAVWDGATWTALEVAGPIRDMVSFDAGDGRALYFGGSFSLIQGQASDSIARLSDTCGANLGIPTCTSTPNSAGLRARMRAAGTASISAGDMTLSARNLPAGASTLFFHGSKERRVPFSDGLRCVGGAQRRVHPMGQATGGTYDLDVNFNAPYASGFMPGNRVYFQAWYQDGMGGPAGSNTTDGLEVIFQP